MPLRLIPISLQLALIYHLHPEISMYTWQRFCLGLLASLLWTSLVVAEFYIDNANSSVQYYSMRSSAWQQYNTQFGTINLTVNDQVIPVDLSTCYDENYALAACETADECQAQIPFAGTGITIYVMNAGFQGVNASLSIDGASSVNGTIPPPTPPSYQTPRVSLLAIQSLAYAYHMATLSILDWDGGNTSLYFDYALVEDSSTQTTTSQPSTPATTPLATPSPANAFSSELPASTFSTIVTATTTTAETTTTGTTTAANSYTSASSLTASGCSQCLHAIEITVPCVIGALLITGVILYLRSRRAKAKKRTASCIPEPFTDTQRSPSLLPPAAEEKARLRATRSRVPTVPLDVSDLRSADDHFFSEYSAGVDRESTNSGDGRGSEESSEFLVNDCARLTASGASLSTPLSDTVVATQRSPTQSLGFHGPPPSYSDRGLSRNRTSWIPVDVPRPSQYT
ncbi:hypothetical protein PISMIDRAFT_177754 [Pisolithus microcarpus 441]|uniref:Uncharacterized protein n=1 Tax=Pisolithus microcarpus 441 TaxID=765257 RepID=A0A0C9YQ63_9AGAM|nr:hypothetical protein PISMIDRAFT_177754 [Pisolithus microcarpus 441]